MAGREKAFEIFVKRAITSIHKEAYGRTKEAKDVKDACQAFLNLLELHESGTQVYDGSLAVAVLHPLQLACCNTNHKIVELALGALHKLVAHAWLQGESSTSEDLIADESDIVTRVIKQVIKCGEINNSSLQLSVIRALLTFTTAEHFVAHGDSLMTAVRAVFNLALGSESEDIKRTACNALLQMLNTVVKRVTAYSYSSCATPIRRDSELETSLTTTTSMHDHIHTQISQPTPHFPSQLAHKLSAAADRAAHMASRPESQETSQDGTSPFSTGVPDERTAQLAQLAEQHDIRGLEAALGGNMMQDGQATMHLPTAGSSSRSPTAADQQLLGGSSLADTAGLPGPRPSALVVPGSNKPTSPLVQLTTIERDVLLVLTAFCKLASRDKGVTEVESYLHQGKLLSLELLVKVLQNPQHRWENVRDAFMRHLRQPLCVAMLRNWQATDAAAFQLASKLLLTVMMQHKLRSVLKAELGAFFPLFVLLPLEQGCGNASQGATGPDGAPLPRQGEPTDLHTLYIVLTTLKSLFGDTQLVVDLFVNYDCDSQAPPLFERTVKVLGQITERTDITEQDRAAAAPGQPLAKQQQDAQARLAAVRDAAVKCITSLVISINQWAVPLKEQQQAAVAPQGTGHESNGHSRGGDGHDGGAGTLDAHKSAGEAERLTAVWEQKSSLARAVSMFNAHPTKGVKFLIQQGLAENKPQSVARFIRQQSKELDKGAVGEYFGHHDPFPISVMHAYIDQESYVGQSIDKALRALLKQFRLPGEAQKIDRIMEKFADRFYLDNPQHFRNADGAYLLAFAIIMLNTDAHNPLAERRLGKSDFVAMCFQTLSEEEGGGMAPVLEQPAIEAIYDRIVADEIVVIEGDTSRASQQASARQQASRRTRLASALGLHLLAAPFKPLTRSWSQTQQDMSDVQRRRGLMELAERVIAHGVGSTWVTAQHAELCRPIMLICAQPILSGLTTGMALAGTAAQAEPLLAALITVAELAAMLRLDEVCEAAVELLARASGVHTPAPPGSPQEAKQLAALKALLTLTSTVHVGSLGSAWAILLRTVSSLEALIEDLVIPEGDQAPVPTPTPAAPVASPFNKMFQAWGISLANITTPARPSDSAAGPTVAVRQVPGAALVTWAATEGKPVIEELFKLSSTLDGETVLVYFRALCAVSIEEMYGPTPRTTFLQRLIQAAHDNSSRIRLVWGKLWALVSAHLVAAACHPSREVALYALEALHDLVQPLLARAELTHFRAQEEALRPFVSVLRQSDDPTVRLTTLNHLLHAVTGQQHGLGRAWKTLLDALTRAASDTNVGVVSTSVQGLQLCTKSLYLPGASGHVFLQECVHTAVLAAQNQAAPAQDSIAAVQLIETAAGQLAAHGPRAAAAADQGSNAHHPGSNGVKQHADEQDVKPLSTRSSAEIPSSGPISLADPWSHILSSLAQVITHLTQHHDRRAAVGTTAAEAMIQLLQAHSQHWGDSAWQVLLSSVLPALFQSSSLTPSSSQRPGSGSAAAPPPPGPEFVSRVQHYFPIMCEKLDQVPASQHEALMSQLTSTALQWLQQSHEPLVKCGLAGYELLVRHAVSSKSSSDLQKLLNALEPVLQAQLMHVMRSVHAAHQKQVNMGAANWSASLGSASHMLLLTHRTLARMQQQHKAALPWAQQVQLLKPMLSCTHQCMLFNQQLEYEVIAAAAQTAANSHSRLKSSQAGAPALAVVPASPAPPAPAPAPEEPPEAAAQQDDEPQQEQGEEQQDLKSKSSAEQGGSEPAAETRVVEGQAGGGAGSSAGADTDSDAGSNDEDMADSILETGTHPTAARRDVVLITPRPVAGTGAQEQQEITAGFEAAGAAGVLAPLPGVLPYMSGTGAATDPQEAHAQLHAGLQQTADGSQLHVSLVRLEMETAESVLDALEVQVEQELGVEVSKGSQEDGALQMLQSLCRQIIVHGAASITQSLQTRLGSDSVTVLDVSAHTEAGHSPVHSTWLEGMRAPLLARAVQLACTMPGTKTGQSVKDLLPHVLTVMCSHQAMVREAVAVYLSQTVLPLVSGDDLN